MRNLLYTMTRGETGKIINFTFEPTNADGVAERTNLADSVVTMTVSKGTTIYIDNAECVADPDQVNNIGKGSFTFDETQADLAAGEYRLRFKEVDNGGNVRYFPTLPNRTYATLKVMAQ